MSETLQNRRTSSDRSSPTTPDVKPATNAVSIVVVSYNHQDFIHECLESCVQQAANYPHLQIVVADDGSTDRTPEIVRSFAERYPSLVVPALSQVNTGIPKNLSRGLAAATGEFVAWLGGDDVMLPNKIAVQAQALAARPGYAGCYHDSEVFEWPSGQTLGLFSELYAGRAATAEFVDAKRMLNPGYQMLPSSVMARRKCMPTEFDQRLKFHNDYLFDLETILAGGPYFRVDGVYARYRKHQKSIGLASSTRRTMLEENLVTMAIVEARYPHLSNFVNRRAVYYLSLEALRLRSDGDRERSLQLVRSIARRGFPLRAFGIALAAMFARYVLDPRFRKFSVTLRSWFS
jgi:glycosyltransferase involved in cell wall biosynthesis